jgi:hypothetical protein
MVFEAFTKVFKTGTIGRETNTNVSMPVTIVLAIETMVFVINKIVGFAMTIVFGIGTMACVKKTTLTAAKKMGSVALTSVCKVFSMGSSIIRIIRKCYKNPGRLCYNRATSEPNKNKETAITTWSRKLRSKFYSIKLSIEISRLKNQFKQRYL